MDFKTLDAYLLSQNGATYDYPFDVYVRVYRVCGKIFALINEQNKPVAINLKCNPLYAVELRTTYESIQAGFHMNKKHWNTVTTGGDVDGLMLEELVDHSYNLVVAGLTKKQREALRN
jgi:predicted DNA-binding protein (MmcQ/YjbR family)